jgi:hypothetical protein
MQATRFRLLALGLTLLTYVFASCADREDRVDDSSGSAGDSSCSACAGNSSEGGDGGNAPSSGGTQGLQPTAGTTAAGTGGASAGAGNTPGGEGGGPPDGPLLEELSLCDRLTQVAAKNLQTTKMFERAVYTDCRVDWLGHRYVDAMARDDYLNDLLTWNQKFWGCQQAPVDDFLLVWGTPPISQGDAEIVIDHYVAAAIEQLGLTAKEEQEMREALERLSTLVVTSASLEPSEPSCVDANGGAGGQGGVGAGGAAGTTSTGGTP